MFICIILLIIIIEKNTRKVGYEFLENLHKKTSVIIKLSFLIGLILMVIFAIFGHLIDNYLFDYNNDDITSIFLFMLYWLVYVFGVSINIVSILYSFKMKSNNSRYEMSINSLSFHIFICCLNLFIPITALIAMARM